jgi:hypothetical protein
LGNVDDPATGAGVSVEGDCRPGTLFGGSSTTIADPAGPPTAIMLDVRPLGVLSSRSEFVIPGSSLLASVAPSTTEYVAWLLPFHPAPGGDFGNPVYDWSAAADGSGIANVSGSVITAYTDDTSVVAGGSVTQRIPPSVSSAIGMIRFQLPLWLALYPRAERCRLDPGNPGGCIDPFASGYAGTLTDPNQFLHPVLGFNSAASDAGKPPIHTVRQGAAVLGVFAIPLDLVSVSARSRIPNPEAPMGGFSANVQLNDANDQRNPAALDPFGTGDLAGVAAGAFLNGDLTTDLNGDLSPDVDTVHAQYVAELGFRPLSMLEIPPVPLPLPFSAGTDGDADGIADGADNCPTVPNSGQSDADSDEVGDSCDNCLDLPNPRDPVPPGHRATGGQVDDDLDGTGNLCDADFTESNGDGFVNVSDLIKFLSAFGKRGGDMDCPGDAADNTGSCWRYDLNVRDEFINVSDLLRMLDGQFFGQPLAGKGCAVGDDALVHCPLGCTAGAGALPCP